MTDLTWEKAEQTDIPQSSNKMERYKFIIGGLLMLAAVVYLVVYSLSSGQYFTTVEALLANPDEFLGKDIRISGAIVDNQVHSVSYVAEGQEISLDFYIAHIPKDTGDLAKTLWEAANDPNAATMLIHYDDVKPGDFKHEAQAIITGQLHQEEDGTFVFYANSLALKCPSRYEEAAPEQVENEG